MKTQTTIPHLTGVKSKAYSVYLPPPNGPRRIVAYPNALPLLGVSTGEGRAHYLDQIAIEGLTRWVINPDLEYQHA